jgi:predicted Zn-dependent protease
MNPRAALTLLALAGCAAARRAPSVPELTAARDRARDAPNDLRARRDRALAELTAPGGDLATAQSELDALAARLPADPGVRFALGLLASQHGDFERALTEYIAAVDAARETADALSGPIAEVTVAKLLALRGDVRDFEGPFRALLSRAETSPGPLGAAARVRLFEGAVRWARERGDADATTRWTARAGCATSFRVAGPFGPLPNLSFDRSFPPEGVGPLAAAYDVGPGRGTLPVYTVRARGCAANLGRGLTLTGVLYASTDFTLAQGGDVVVYVESPNAFAVLLDGVSVATLDPRGRATGASVHVPLRLVAGRHTLRVKVASGYHSPLVMAAVTDPSGVPVAEFTEARGAANPSPPTPLDAPTDPADDAYLPAAQQPATAFGRYVYAELAYARRNVVAARELLRPLATGEDGAVATLIAWSSVAQADPFMTVSQQRDRARRALETVRRKDPRAYFAPLQLARLTAQDERADEALAMVREAARNFPDNPEVESELADRLMQRNWEGEARAVLDRARARHPDQCWPARMLLSLAQRRGDGADEAALAETIRRCDALSDVPAQAFRRMRRWDEATRELERLLANEPDGRAMRRSLAEIARSRGELAEALRLGRELLPQLPEDDTLRADLADLAVATGRRDEARALLDGELARRPAELSGLFRLRAWLAGREDLAAWRLDGPAVLREFDASGRSYDSSAVLVLDYTVRRNFRDGSALELTHNVIRVQSQEGVEQYGEFSPPGNATLWRVRTLKADGRVLEPEVISGRDNFSLPELRPGDAVEFEYVRALPPVELAPGGFLGDRFYFRGFDVPYHRSEYVVVVPEGMPLVVDPRGALPETQRTVRDGLQEYRWVARQSERMTAEPASIAGREFIPSVAVGVGATWERFVDALRERLVESDARDPDAVRLAREVVGDARSADAKLTRLHHWVLANIQQEGGGTPFDSAPRMLSARQGHRTRVLCYLLNLSDVPCELALVRQGSADATVSELADDSTFQSLLLRVRADGAERWITAADSHAPTDYVPPATAGGEAVMLSANTPRTRVPALDLNRHGRALRVELSLDADGSGRATVVETLTGYAATGARAALRRMDGANRTRQFEAYVGGMVAGASLASLEVEGVEDVEAPVVLRYAFTAPGLASRQGTRLTFDGIFHTEAARTWAETPTRTVPLWNGDPVNASMDLTVRVPAGAQLDEVPEAQTGEAPGVQWSMRWTRVDGGFRVDRLVRVPTGRVTVADYGAFAGAVRALDTADTRRVTMTLSGR